MEITVNNVFGRIYWFLNSSGLEVEKLPTITLKRNKFNLARKQTVSRNRNCVFFSQSCILIKTYVCGAQLCIWGLTFLMCAKCLTVLNISFLIDIQSAWYDTRTIMKPGFRLYTNTKKHNMSLYKYKNQKKFSGCDINLHFGSWILSSALIINSNSIFHICLKCVSYLGF